MSARKPPSVTSSANGRARAARKPRRSAPPAAVDTSSGWFFRDVVSSMRNGVVVITRDGRIAFMNDVACRAFGCEVTDRHLRRPFSEVLRDTPDIVRILAGAFDISMLPNRAELRLKTSGKVIGDTLTVFNYPTLAEPYKYAAYLRRPRQPGAPEGAAGRSIPQDPDSTHSTRR